MPQLPDKVLFLPFRAPDGCLADTASIDRKIYTCLQLRICAPLSFENRLIDSVLLSRNRDLGIKREGLGPL
jgi:hypothetical protein